jgi:hypothetical protein
MAKREALKRELDKHSGKAPAADLDIAYDGVPSASGYVPPPSRRGKVTFAIHVLPSVRAQMKSLAAERGTTVQALVEDGINMVFEKYGKTPIA